MKLDLNIGMITVWVFLTLIILLSAIANEHTVNKLTIENVSLKAQVSFLLNDSKQLNTKHDMSH